MLKKLARFFQRGHREFELFQIEVSSFSSLDCPICPRAVFAEKWIFQNMPLETFQKISPYFPLTEWISFQGWGDPLANEHIISMLRLAKEAECLTSLTTNGDLLTAETSQQLLKGDLDLLIVSLEVAAPAIQENLLRTNSDLKRIFDQVERFIHLKKNSRANKPTVKFSLPMTRINMRELPGLIPLTANMGVNEIIFTNLDYLPDERWNILRAFYHESPTSLFGETIAEINRLAKKEGIAIKTYPLKAEEIPVCEADPSRKVFLAVDGSIAPCQYLRLPQNGPIPRIFLNKEYSVAQTIFGNIDREDFLTIWNQESYQAFRKVFTDRKKAEVNMGQILDAFSNIRSTGMQERDLKEPPPLLPEVCQTCYKAYGI